MTIVDNDTIFWIYDLKKIGFKSVQFVDTFGILFM